MVEAWFSILTGKSVRRDSFASVRSLTQHIRDYIDHWNLNATRFVWTRQPAEIIGKAVRRERYIDLQDRTLGMVRKTPSSVYLHPKHGQQRRS